MTPHAFPRLALRAAVAASLVATLFFQAAARADEHRGNERRPDFRPAPVWRGDIHRFHEHDWTVWRGGRWVHGPHNGRPGWWWVVGGVWYFYPAPVYPYPSPWEPPELVTPTPDSPPPTQYWYWCDGSQQYYPYAASCPGGWRQVPAQPTAPPPR
jgi:hypothetical protein